MTYLVFHGAEHTRFAHSLGVMFLVTKAFNSAVEKGEYEFSEAKKDWYTQILRLIALTHDYITYQLNKSFREFTAICI